MGATICILPSHASTKTSRTWKFGAFKMSQICKYFGVDTREIKTSMEPWNLSALQVVSTEHIQWNAGDVRLVNGEQVWSQGSLKQQLPHTTQRVMSSKLVQPFVSSLHMPRRKHQEHGSLERSIHMLGVDIKENKNQHMEPWDLSALKASSTLTRTQSSKPTMEYPEPGRSK